MTVRGFLSRCVRGALGLGVAAAALSLGAPERPEASRAARLELEHVGAVARVKSFTMSGGVGGLYPGGETSLPVTIVNPNKQDMLVTSITVSAADSGGCESENVDVRPLAKPVLVRRQAEAVASITIGLERSAGDECKGVTFALTFSGVGEGV